MPTEFDELARHCKAVVIQLHRFRNSHGEAAYTAALEAWRGVSGRDMTMAMTDATESLDALARLEELVSSNVAHAVESDPIVTAAAGNLLFNAVSEVIGRNSPTR